MEHEILACIDEKNIKYLQSGHLSKYIFPMERSKAHNQKICHLITRFFIISKSPEEKILYLVQKRAKNKETYPEYFTDSSSGHVNYEKNLDLNKIKKNAIRELEEEFSISQNALQKVLFYDIKTEGIEIAYIFFGIVNFNIDIHPDPKELDCEASRFYIKDELETILNNEKNVDYSKEIWQKILNTDIISLFEKKRELKKESRNKIALFIGRFQPLHHGHIYVIKEILKRYEIIKIGIGSSQLSHTLNNPFTKEERKEFVNAAFEKRNISSKQFQIFYIPDIFNAKKWVDHVISIVGELDSVVSNSDWVRELFHNKAINVEKKITIFKKKFNGNNIRNLIIQNNKKWKNLVPNEVIELIQEYNGINRIKSLYEKETNP
ncbi:MAG: nicotinamide-nucleotide adenylyltransferase [Promethearchaeota archaeon]